MRAIALAASLIGLVIFAIPPDRFFPRMRHYLPSACFACRGLVEYAAEVKQYGCDATLATAMLLVAIGRPETPAPRRLLRLRYLRRWRFGFRIRRR